MRMKFEGVRAREDNLRMLENSGLLQYRHVPHTPYLAFIPETLPDGTSRMCVRAIVEQSEMLKLPNATHLLVQWRGQWSSDYFHLTVGEVRRYLLDTDEPWLREMEEPWP